MKVFLEGQLHPMDLKKGATKYMNMILEPVRKVLETN